MGAYISRGTCKSAYGIDIDCEVKKYSNGTIYKLGNTVKGNFEGDGDIAGIGIFGTFIAVTSFALLLSLVVVICGMIKHRIFPFQRCGDGFTLTTKTTPRSKEKIKPGISEICQGMVLSCSDAQIFTGAAYALTLRYFRGCTITAYHYNVVANLMLLSCATHLMAITVVRNYWEFAWLAVLRVVCKTGVFLFAGILLSNQNASEEYLFPTKIPPMDSTNSTMFLFAACFQSKDTNLATTLDDSLRKGNFVNSVVLSTPGNRIEGWNKYLIILLWYIVAVFMEFAMFIRKGNRHDGNRRKLVTAFWRVMVSVGKVTVECMYRKGKKKSQPTSSQAPPIGQVQATSTPIEETSEKRTIRHLKCIGQYLITIYYLIGIGICMWTVAASGYYIGHLKQWVQDSGWLSKDDKGVNAENDATSFGQLVPIFTSGLVAFTFLEMISTAMSRRRDARLQPSQEISDEEQPLPSPEQEPYKYEYTFETKPVLPTPSPEPVEPSPDEIAAAPTHQPSLPVEHSYFPPSPEPASSTNTGPLELASPSLVGSPKPVTGQPTVDELESGYPEPGVSNRRMFPY
ncbi:hypothetical protein FGRMN_2950 [Fusarium graminum]|nr:hypothetical protein FGRMN_2950 [Fusarium graminum]